MAKIAKTKIAARRQSGQVRLLTSWRSFWLAEEFDQRNIYRWRQRHRWWWREKYRLQWLAWRPYSATMTNCQPLYLQVHQLLSEKWKCVNSCSDDAELLIFIYSKLERHRHWITPASIHRMQPFSNDIIRAFDDILLR